MATLDSPACSEAGNVISMARIELLNPSPFCYLITGPVPVVRGTHFPPFQTIRLEVCCRDGNGRPWKSVNVYKANQSGVFDTSLTAATGEAYHGVDPEGPFTSMTCQLGPGYDFGNDLPRLTYTLSCFVGISEIWTRQVTRYRGGEPYPASLSPWVRVLLFDDNVGFEDGDVASALAAYGIAVTGHILEACPEVGGGPFPLGRDLPTFVVGSGRASARALDAALRLRAIQAVILFSGSGLRFAATDSLGGSFDDVECDALELDTASLMASGGDDLCTRQLYIEAVADTRMRDLASIRVENIACPIYMFSGLDDQIWPSSAFCELIMRRREANGSSFPTLHRVFEGVGHDLGPSLGWPTLPTSERTVSHPDTYARLRLGGKSRRQARARRDPIRNPTRGISAGMGGFILWEAMLESGNFRTTSRLRFVSPSRS